MQGTGAAHSMSRLCQTVVLTSSPICAPYTQAQSTIGPMLNRSLGAGTTDEVS